MVYPKELLELVDFEKSNSRHSILGPVKVEIKGCLNLLNRNIRYTDIEKFWVHIFYDDFEFKSRMDLKFIHQIGSRVKWEDGVNDYTLDQITKKWIDEITKDISLNSIINKIENVFNDAFLNDKNLDIICNGNQNPFLIYGIVSRFYEVSDQLEFRDKFINKCSEISGCFNLLHTNVYYNKEFKSVTEYFLFKPQKDDAFNLSCGLVYGKNNGYGSYSIVWRRVTKKSEAIFLPIQSSTKSNWKNNPRYVNLPNEGIDDFVENIVTEGLAHKRNIEEKYRSNVNYNFTESIIRDYFNRILSRITIAKASKDRVIDQWEKEYLNKGSSNALSSWSVCETLTFVGTYNKAIPESMRKLLRQAGTEIFDANFEKFFKIYEKNNLCVKCSFGIDN